jgi:glutaredoxin-like protein NrdH
MIPPITLYGSSLCEHCAAAKVFFEQRSIPFTYINVDVLIGQERNDVMAILNRAAMFPSLPTIMIGEKLVAGFSQEAIEGILKGYEAASI